MWAAGREDGVVRRVGALAVLAVLALAEVPAAGAEGRTLHVSATAKPGGDGSRALPFDSLARVERASHRGDRIIVRPVPPSAAPLDGGIALKPGQTLAGAGPAVRGSNPPARVPQLTNTSAERHSGNAVTLADGVRVRNLVIAGAHRGAIYGNNTTAVTIKGNNVSGHNVSCTVGFHIQPFVLPSMAPGVGVPISEGLTNGWAGIMIDADRARGARWRPAASTSVDQRLSRSGTERERAPGRGGEAGRSSLFGLSARPRGKAGRAHLCWRAYLYG